MHLNTPTVNSAVVHKAKRTSGYLAPVLWPPGPSRGVCRVCLCFGGYLAPVLWTPGPSRGVCRVCLHIFAPIEFF